MKVIQLIKDVRTCKRLGRQPVKTRSSGSRVTLGESGGIFNNDYSQARQRVPDWIYNTLVEFGYFDSLYGDRIVTKIKRFILSLRVKGVLAWYDFWAGIYFDQKKGRLYFMIPFIGFYIYRKQKSHSDIVSSFLKNIGMNEKQSFSVMSKIVEQGKSSGKPIVFGDNNGEGFAVVLLPQGFQAHVERFSKYGSDGTDEVTMSFEGVSMHRLGEINKDEADQLTGNIGEVTNKKSD